MVYLYKGGGITKIVFVTKLVGCVNKWAEKRGVRYNISSSDLNIFNIFASHRAGTSFVTSI